MEEKKREEIFKLLRSEDFQMQVEIWEEEAGMYRREIKEIMAKNKGSIEKVWKDEEKVATKIAIVLSAVENLPQISKMRGLFPIVCPEIVQFAEVVSMKDTSDEENRQKMEKYTEWEKRVFDLLEKSVEGKEDEVEAFQRNLEQWTLQMERHDDENPREIKIAASSFPKARSFLLLNFLHSVCVLLSENIE